jgi:phage-related protein
MLVLPSMGKKAVLDFLDDLEPEALEKVAALLEYVSEHGIPKNETKSGVIEDGLYELKSYQVRLAFIYDSSRRRTILIVYALLKKADKWPKDDVKAAKRAQADTTEAIAKGSVEYGE